MEAVWLLLAIATALAEGYALGRPEKGDTLSEQVWALLRRPWFRWGVAVPFWAWLTWHFFMEGAA